MNGSGSKSKQIIQILFLAVMALYIVIKDVTIPLMKNQGQKPSTVEISERLARLEESTIGLKTTVDRIERKLDQHVIGGK